MQRNKRTIRILSIDGGGIRGFIPAEVLNYLEKLMRRPAAHSFDIVAGTSVGGIIALMLTMRKEPGSTEPKYTAEQIRDMFRANADRIFQSNGFTIGGLMGSKYTNEGLIEFCNETFGDALLSEALCESVVAVSYELEQRMPVFFSSAKARADQAMDFFVRDVALATAAAPTYFPPAHIRNVLGDPFYMVDGGLIANNPTQRAFMESRRMYPYVPLNRYIILSIGTGTSNAPIYYHHAYGMGKIGWAGRVIDITLDGMSEAVHCDMAETFGLFHVDRGFGYIRVQGSLEAASECIDDVSPLNLRALELDAQSIIRRKEVQLKQLSAHVLMSPQPVLHSSSQDERQRFELLEQVSDPLLVVDRRGVVYYVNQACQSFLEVESACITGCNVMQWLAKESRIDMVRALRQVANQTASEACGRSSPDKHMDSDDALQVSTEEFIVESSSDDSEDLLIGIYRVLRHDHSERSVSVSFRLMQPDEQCEVLVVLILHPLVDTV